MDLLVAQNVYSLSCQAALKIFEIASRFPQDGHKALHDVIISTSSMVCDNLLNAWQNRTNDDIFSGMLDSAIINVKQTRLHIDHAVVAGVLKSDDAKLVRAIYERVDEKINNLKNQSGQ
ncbi:hypothetical protein A2Y85_02785 [candidate division WOR-3 bacterium RBG_13_43_14]|uniref:Four helix bundle protein n=1 Tax=candidate division WOR-3 bacterium RBG_13_43_14 TaxID=1802590 RepID=A0A1F4U2P8_UNCW3|nr:MAG: hypothetical protein A2Y85_02785 [candidate division WOR-3 bacterium RBG_13_43_14]